MYIKLMIPLLFLGSCESHKNQGKKTEVKVNETTSVVIEVKTSERSRNYFDFNVTFLNNDSERITVDQKLSTFSINMNKIGSIFEINKELELIETDVSFQDTGFYFSGKGGVFLKSSSKNYFIFMNSETGVYEIYQTENGK